MANPTRGVILHKLDRELSSLSLADSLVVACYFIFSSLTANADTQINVLQERLVRLPTPDEFSTTALKLLNQ